MSLKRIALAFALLSLLTAGALAHDADSHSMRWAQLRWGRNGVMLDLTSKIVLEATGLDAPTLHDSLMEGATINELITDNGGEPTETSATLTAQIREQMAAAAQEQIAALDEWVNDTLHQSHADKGRRWRRIRPVPRMPFGDSMNGMVLEAAGLDRADLRSALADGSTIAELIEANDGDVDEVAASLVAHATEQINEATATRSERVSEIVDEAMQRDFSDMFERMKRFRRNPRGFFDLWRGFGMGGDNAKSAQTQEA